jgi:hypothetical protein
MAPLTVLHSAQNRPPRACTIRPADREPHTQTFLLCGEEWFEYAGEIASAIPFPESSTVNSILPLCDAAVRTSFRNVMRFAILSRLGL